MPNVRLPPTALLLRHARADQPESSIAGFHRGFMRVNNDVLDNAS
jgi:hypothetical protein